MELRFLALSIFILAIWKQCTDTMNQVELQRRLINGLKEAELSSHVLLKDIQEQRPFITRLEHLQLLEQKLQAEGEHPTVQKVYPYQERVTSSSSTFDEVVLDIATIRNFLTLIRQQIQELKSDVDRHHIKWGKVNDGEGISSWIQAYAEMAKRQIKLDQMYSEFDMQKKVDALRRKAGRLTDEESRGIAQGALERIYTVNEELVASYNKLLHSMKTFSMLTK
jgi:hypothetical protein